ncbi:MAG TPA: intein-containing Rv2578c family radical SAM protein [Micromonosporaceae bacterium]|nr:intein-containing Rv2578c family radical SAM protein [Micromonosporaceae bacterium]
MRWSNLSAVGGPAAVAANGSDGPAQPAARAASPLPLALPNAVVRTFDTPGFAGMTFYEVRAKSIINRVPGASRVPFEWTVNPYRGCSHACTYCLAGETPILMADGGLRPLADLRVGDQIYGTAAAGRGRAYTRTTVLAHWSTVKPAYRVILADGTSLVASGDHRFLTERGWRHVTRRRDGGPGLAPGLALVGTGRFAEGPKDTVDYRLGYLCGTIRGSAREGRRSRVPLADGAALRRFSDYLTGMGAIAGGGPPGRPIAVTDLVRWPAGPTDTWRKGFLAGLFDAAGRRVGDELEFVDADESVVRHARAALTRFGFDTAVDTAVDPAPGVRTLRVRGGRTEQLRFRHFTEPAVDRHWRLDREPVTGAADLRVVAVEPLGMELPLYDITTGTGDFIANGVVSHNCFARSTHTYLDLDAGADFDTKVVVKVNAGALLRRELAAPRWRGGHIAMGTNVDCYQRAEGRYGLMREIIAALRDFANPFSILTKGTLILRDLELLRQAAEVTRVGVSFSVGFLDETLWRSVESGTPSPRRRLDAVRALTDAGFQVGVLMAPVLPGLTDSDESIDATVAAIAAAGAATVTPIGLHLRPGARQWYSAWLARNFPQLGPRYRELYRNGSYLPKDYQRDLSDRVRAAARRHGLDRAAPGEARSVPEPPAPPEPVQLTLL